MEIYPKINPLSYMLFECVLIHSIFGIHNYQIIVGFKRPISPDRTNRYLVSNTSSAGKNSGLFVGGGVPH